MRVELATTSTAAARAVELGVKLHEEGNKLTLINQQMGSIHIQTLT